MQRLDRGNLQDSIILQIKKYIFNNQLEPGDMLPSQQVMVERMGASRTSIREAIKTMSALGLVRVVNGKGIIVEQIDHSFYDGEINNDYRIKMLKESLFVRRALEGSAIELATKLSTDEELKELSNILSEVEAKYYKKESQADLDLKFHKNILELSKNSLLIHLTGSFLRQESGLWHMPEYEADIFTQSIPAHRTVVNYMLARDHVNAVRAHNDYMDRILDGIDGIHGVNSK